MESTSPATLDCLPLLRSPARLVQLQRTDQRSPMQVSCLGPALNAVQASCGAEVPVCNSRQRLSWKAWGLPPLHASQHQQQRQIGHVLGQRAGRFCGNAADLWRHGAPLLPRCGRRAARGPQATANILPASDILAAVQMPLGRDMAGDMPFCGQCAASLAERSPGPCPSDLHNVCWLQVRANGQHTRRFCRGRLCTVASQAR